MANRVAKVRKSKDGPGPRTGRPLRLQGRPVLATCPGAAGGQDSPESGTPLRPPPDNTGPCRSLPTPARAPLLLLNGSSRRPCRFHGPHGHVWSPTRRACPGSALLKARQGCAVCHILPLAPAPSLTRGCVAGRGPDTMGPRGRHPCVSLRLRVSAGGRAWPSAGAQRAPGWGELVCVPQGLSEPRERVPGPSEVSWESVRIPRTVSCLTRVPCWLETERVLLGSSGKKVAA